MKGMARVLVMDSVRAAVAFARANVGRVAGVLALVMLLNIAGDMAASPFALVATTLATLLAGIMANAALLRLAFAEEAPSDPEFRIGPQGFQFGGPELRLLGAMLLLLLFGFIALLFMVLIAALIDVGLIFSHGGGAVLTPEAASHSPEMQLTSAVLILIFGVMAIWVWVRVFTYPAATIAAKRIQVFSTWRLTHGRSLSIFAAVLIVFSPVLVLDVLLMAAQGRPGLMLVLAVLSAAAHAFLEIPLLCGLSAHVYKALRATPAPVAAGAAPPASPGLAGPWG
jgi:hypothetical protein